MFRVNLKANVERSFLIGDILLVISELEKKFPDYNKGSYKVSQERIFQKIDKPDVVFTLYDWKATNLYSPNYCKVEEFWKMKESWVFNIGGYEKSKKHLEEFKIEGKTESSEEEGIIKLEDVIKQKQLEKGKEKKENIKKKRKAKKEDTKEIEKEVKKKTKKRKLD